MVEHIGIVNWNALLTSVGAAAGEQIANWAKS